MFGIPGEIEAENSREFLVAVGISHQPAIATVYHIPLIELYLVRRIHEFRKIVMQIRTGVQETGKHERLGIGIYMSHQFWRAVRFILNLRLGRHRERQILVGNVSPFRPLDIRSIVCAADRQKKSHK
jgi:hypothetical protein